MATDGETRGFLVVAVEPSAPRQPHLETALRRLGIGGNRSERAGPHWRLISWPEGTGTTDEVGWGVSTNRTLPPDLQVTVADAEVTVRSDWLGFAQLFARSGHGWSAVSSSAVALAALAPTDLDRTATGELALMGWLVGDRTPFVGISTLPPGSTTTLRAGRMTTTPAGATALDGSHGPEAVREAAALLRASMADILDAVPDVVLQLTGGLDSRVLLGAVPRARRVGLHALTLEVAGSQDAMLAARLADRCGLRHEVVPTAEPRVLPDEEWLARCLRSSLALSASADPVARTALESVEAAHPGQVRIAGLGGEVARGFYYAGPDRGHEVSRTRVARLALWRLFPNGAVPDGMLTPQFAAQATETTIDEVLRVMRASGATDWFAATDEFYLWQRMRRWAGTIATAQPRSRTTINPMLDRDFLNLVRGLPSSDKRNMRFLARLMIELDPDLARLPLDGRPSPMSYGNPGPGNATRLLALNTRKVGRKVRQRVAGVRRAPAGGNHLAQATTRALRRSPDVLRAAVDADVVDAAWYESVLDGRTELTPAALALLSNVAGAATAAGGSGQIPEPSV